MDLEKQNTKENIKIIIEQAVDYLLPEITPYEFQLYLYLLRNSFIKNGTFEMRIGKRTIGSNIGSSRGANVKYEHVTQLLKRLEEIGCIKIGDTNREGTLYVINLPQDIPLVAEKIEGLFPQNLEADYFNDSEKRNEVFERDKWTCQYCGEKLSNENATLDHYIPLYSSK